LFFSFNLDITDEIIDAYIFDYAKLGSFEIKNNNGQLALYEHSVYVKDIPEPIDFDKYKTLLIVQ